MRQFGNGQVAVRVITTLRNGASQPVALDRCSSDSHTPIYDVLSASDGTSPTAYAVVWGCAAAPPIIVGPGATRIDTLRLIGATRLSSDGQPVGSLEGSFRIVYGGHESNAFQITLSPGGPIASLQRDSSADVQTDSSVRHRR